jgi:hypothetical protein
MHATKYTKIKLIIPTTAHAHTKSTKQKRTQEEQERGKLPDGICPQHLPIYLSTHLSRQLSPGFSNQD